MNKSQIVKPHPLIRPARLIKQQTDDKMVEFTVPIGTEYFVDLSTRREVGWFNTEYRVHHVKVVVDCIDGGCLPLECLEIL